MEYGQRGSASESDDPWIVRLYQQHALTLMTYIRRHVSSREDAEDIVLEVFLAALQQPKLARLSVEEQMAWLQRVAYYKWVDCQRRAASRTAVSLEEAAETLLANEAQSPDQLAVRYEEDALLRQQLGRLPVQYQTILQLRFANGLRCTEIASRLHKSEGATRMLLSRALNALREIYAGEKEEQR
jgi:RNA polymerase sigma-70 factor (ECF subfamily)